MIRLSASKIASLIVYGVRFDPFVPPAVENAMKQGRIIHSRLGFTNSQIFSRYLRVGKELVLISGMPDLIDEEKGEVLELKTYHSPTSKKRNLKYATIQVRVYSFVTGLEKGKVVLYHISDKKKEEIPILFDKVEFRRNIMKALKVIKLMDSFKNNYKKINSRE